jgi:hypothetical protein
VRRRDGRRRPGREHRPGGSPGARVDHEDSQRSHRARSARRRLSIRDAAAGSGLGRERRDRGRCRPGRPGRPDARYAALRSVRSRQRPIPNRSTHTVAGPRGRPGRAGHHPHRRRCRRRWLPLRRSDLSRQLETELPQRRTGRADRRLDGESRIRRLPAARAGRRPDELRRRAVARPARSIGDQRPGGCGCGGRRRSGSRGPSRDRRCRVAAARRHRRRDAHEQ